MWISKENYNVDKGNKNDDTNFSKNMFRTAN